MTSWFRESEEEVIVAPEFKGLWEADQTQVSWSIYIKCLPPFNLNNLYVDLCKITVAIVGYRNDNRYFKKFDESLWALHLFDFIIFKTNEEETANWRGDKHEYSAYEQVLFARFCNIGLLIQYK